MCGCNKPAVERTVHKETENKDRKFWCCSAPKEEGCGFFVRICCLYCGRADYLNADESILLRCSGMVRWPVRRSIRSAQEGLRRGTYQSLGLLSYLLTDFPSDPL